MKCFVAFVALTIVAVSGEAPVQAPFFSSRNAHQQQQQVAYPPSGYRPSGAQFRLPERQQEVPQTLYVPPQQVGNNQQGRNNNNNNDQVQTTTEQNVRSVNKTRNATGSEEENAKLVEGAENSFVEEGVYYLYHPDGLLQRVVYSTKNDVQDMGYTAQLRYQNVQPITDPIYTYDPQTYVLQRVQF